jgi:signal transduction histidine kinase
MAFIFTVLFITASMVQLQYLYYQDINPDTLFVEEYKNSEYFLYHDVSNALSEISSMFNEEIKLSQKLDYYYYITDGNKTYNNIELHFIKQLDTLYSYENGGWTYGKNADNGQYLVPDYYFPDNYKVYIAFSNEYMAKQQQILEYSRGLLLPSIIFITSCCILSLICITYLIFITGKTSNDMKIHLSQVDNIYSDIQLAVAAIFISIWFALEESNWHVYGSMSNEITTGQVLSMVITGVSTAIEAILCGIILLSLTRKMKTKRFIKHSLIYSVLHKISDFIKSFFDDRRFKNYPLTKSLQKRQIIFIIASAGMVFFTILFMATGNQMAFFPVVLEFVIIYWYYTENNKTYDEINKGFNESLEEQMKSERMKIALVTNVSHDLKTPLTSIISYVDLLSKEDLSDTARDYVKILADKSDRLKNIVSDLFDLAKSTSGNMPLDMESIDIKKLIEQTLADMEDEISKSGLQIKTKLPDYPVHIISDGKKLYRVFKILMIMH